MKKLLALLLALTMVLAFAGCGDKPQESAEPASSGEVSEISGVVDNLSFNVVGMELCDYWDNKALRIWADVTNNSQYIKEPRMLEGYSIIGYQNGEELETCLSDNRPEEEYYWISDFYPGTSARVAFSYQLPNDQDTVSLWFEFEDGEKTFDIDLANLPGAPADKFTLAPITDTSWFTAESETIEVFDVVYSVVGTELVPGYDHNGEADILRVTFKAQHAGTEDTYIGTPFTPFQDGLELDTAEAKEKSDIELEGATTIHPGETVNYTKDYMLYSMDPVAFLELSIAGQNGVILNIA